MPGANAVQVMAGARKTMEQLSKRFPPGMTYTITVDRTRMVIESIHEVMKTLLIAIVLVVIVIFLFLQNWRATLIPSIAIPVALVGAFTPMAFFGFSLNTLSLLGLVRHLAGVEVHWFQQVLQGRTDVPRPYREDGDRDGEFTGAVPDPAVVEEAFARWRAETARADAWLDDLDERELGREVPLGDGTVSVRDVLVHLVEEYARHAGHADLLRECLDGRTGQ